MSKEITFSPWRGQHKQLGGNIATDGLAAITDELADLFSNCLDRFEQVVHREGDASDTALFEEILNLPIRKKSVTLIEPAHEEDGIKLGAAYAVKLVERERKWTFDETENTWEANSWRIYYETLLEFIFRITNQPKFVVASALYILQCDEYAAGLYNNTDNFTEYLSAEYRWALSFDENSSGTREFSSTYVGFNFWGGNPVGEAFTLAPIQGITGRISFTQCGKTTAKEKQLLAYLRKTPPAGNA